MFARPRNRRGDHGAMAAMDAFEIAHCNDRASERAGPRRLLDPVANHKEGRFWRGHEIGPSAPTMQV
jgi:hypothetical protein